MSSSLKGLKVLASFAVQPVTRETESERYFENHSKFFRVGCLIRPDPIGPLLAGRLPDQALCIYPGWRVKIPWL